MSETVSFLDRDERGGTWRYSAATDMTHATASGSSAFTWNTCTREREFFMDNLLVRTPFIIVVIRWIGLAPWEFEFLFPGSLTSTFPTPAPNFI